MVPWWWMIAPPQHHSSPGGSQQTRRSSNILPDLPNFSEPWWRRRTHPGFHGAGLKHYQTQHGTIGARVARSRPGGATAAPVVKCPMPRDNPGRRASRRGTTGTCGVTTSQLQACETTTSVIDGEKEGRATKHLVSNMFVSLNKRTRINACM